MEYVSLRGRRRATAGPSEAPVGYLPCHFPRRTPHPRWLSRTPRFVRRLDARHRAWRYRTRVDPAEIRWLRAMLRPGDVAVDAGAYKGGYTYWMRHAVGARGSVLAIEPQPELAAYLRDTAVAFGWSNVHVEQAALSSSEGEAVLHVPGDAPSQRGSLVVERAGARAVAVRVRTLDTVLEGRASPRPVRLLKVDVEGNELQVLRGAERTLLRDRPLLLFECEERFGAAGSVERVLAYVGALGYRGGFFWRGELLDVVELDLGVHQREGTKPYANNFAFVPS